MDKPAVLTSMVQKKSQIGVIYGTIYSVHFKSWCAPPWNIGDSGIPASFPLNQSNDSSTDSVIYTFYTPQLGE